MSEDLRTIEISTLLQFLRNFPNPGYHLCVAENKNFAILDENKKWVGYIDLHGKSGKLEILEGNFKGFVLEAEEII